MARRRWPRTLWSHLAATYDGATMRLYMNGALVSSQARTGAIATSANPLQIGGDSLYGQYFNGNIDEVRIYNRALTQAEIQADMNTPLGGATPDSTPPSAPAGLAATAAGSGAINLSWTASTDNVGVTGYRVERCQGAGCSDLCAGGDAERDDVCRQRSAGRTRATATGCGRWMRRGT